MNIMNPAIPPICRTNNDLIERFLQENAQVTKVSGKYTLGKGSFVISEALKAYHKFLNFEHHEASSVSRLLPTAEHNVRSLERLHYFLAQYRDARNQQSEGRGTVGRALHNIGIGLHRALIPVTTLEFTEHTTDLMNRIKEIAQAYQQIWRIPSPTFPIEASQEVLATFNNRIQIEQLYHKCSQIAANVTPSSTVTKSPEGFYLLEERTRIAELLKTYEKALPLQEEYLPVSSNLKQQIKDSLTTLQDLLTYAVADHTDEKSKRGVLGGAAALMRATTRVVTTGANGEHSKDLLEKMDHLLKLCGGQQ